MATAKGSYGTVSLTSRRSGSTWSEAKYTAQMTLSPAVPQNSTVSSATLTATVSEDPISGSTVYLNGIGIDTGRGTHTISVSVAPGTSTYQVAFSFRGKGTGNSVSALVFSGLELTVSYTLNQVTSGLSLDKATVEAGGTIRATVVPGRSGYTHRLTVRLGSRSSAQTLATGVTAADVSIPAAWLDQMPNSQTGQGTITLETLENGVAFGSVSAGLTVTTPASAAPKIGTCAVEPLLTVGKTTYPDVSGGGYVQSKCGYRASITGAEGQYGASIASYSIVGGGYSAQTATLASGLLTASGDVQITFRVVDSRGLTATRSETIKVLPYTAPTITGLSAWRVNADGNADKMGTLGKWTCAVSYTTLSGKNSLTCSAWIEDAAGGKTGIAAGADGQQWIEKQDGGKVTLSATKKYTLVLTAQDLYGSVTREIEIPSAMYAMHFNSAGNGVCFGGASTRENAVEIVAGRTLWVGDRQVVPGGQVAYNLLDNSDFRNPVNQRGITSGATIDKWAYCIDRWKNMSAATATVTLSSAGIKSTQTIAQFVGGVDALVGKTCTAAACWADGTVLVATGVIAKSATYKELAVSETVNGHQVMVVDNGNSSIVSMRVLGNTSVAVVWAALYEGAYTADTLPPYIPKGYAVELAECRRYFIRDVAVCTMGTQYTSANGLVAVHVPRMRANPTFTLRSVSSQGWGTIELSKFSSGWSSSSGSGYTMNFVYSGTADTRGNFIGVTFTMQYDASADL